MRGQQHDAKVCCDKRHRVFLGPGKVCEKFRVARKTITAEKERTFINRRRRYRIDASRRAQLDRCFDVTSRGFTRSARLDSGFDKSVNVVEVIDDWFGELFRERFASTNDVVTGLKIESACRVSQ